MAAVIRSVFLDSMKQYKKIYELKNTAKDKLEGKYGGAVLILLLSALMSGGWPQAMFRKYRAIPAFITPRRMVARSSSASKTKDSAVTVFRESDAGLPPEPGRENPLPLLAHDEGAQEKAWRVCCRRSLC